MIKNILTLRDPLRFMALALTAFMLIAVAYRSEGALSDSSKSLLTVTSFVFGFYINNLITQARSRHAKVVESLREEGGYIKAIYFILVSSFPTDKIKGGREAIDEYLVASMDYKVIDYSKSSPEFKALYHQLMNLNPETKQQDGGWGQIIRIISEVSRNRTKIETMVKERVSSFEWLTVSILLVLVLYFVYTLNSWSLVSMIVTACIATSLTMLLVVLQSLDSLRWKEDKFFWDPLEEMFVSLDLIPYYPQILVDTGRLKINKKKPVRLAKYPHPYPDMRDKEVIVRQ